MVTHIIGKLGSGKSLYAVKMIIDTLLQTEKHIYTNVRLRDFWDYKVVSMTRSTFKNLIRFILSPFISRNVYRSWLAKSYALRYHYFTDINELVKACLELKTDKEHTRLFVWDEIHLELNAREWKSTSMKVIQFFSMSRKLGFDVLMITQLKSALDRQVRDLAEEVYELKNLANYRPLGYRIFPHVGLLSKRYADAGSDAGVKKGMFMGFQIVRYNSEYISFYDTLQMLTKKQLTEPETWSSRHEKNVICGNCIFMQFYVENSGWIKEFKTNDIEYKYREAKRKWWIDWKKIEKKDFWSIVEKAESDLQSVARSVEDV
jgi:hypothetical protein